MVAPEPVTTAELATALGAVLHRPAAVPVPAFGPRLLLGRAYVPTLVDQLRPAMVERLDWHRTEGHAIVIVSASLGAYLRPLAEHLALDAALAVELVADAEGILTGEVVGQLNTRGPEKVARLRAWADQRYGPAGELELWAYGDSAGDEALLAAADHPTWVGHRADRNP